MMNDCTASDIETKILSNYSLSDCLAAKTMASPFRTILLAISGPSCSGKTTLARLLRTALAPDAIIVHEDDFFLSDATVPVVTAADGRQLHDWDCLEAVDVAGLEAVLRTVRESGRLPDGIVSQEELNETGHVPVDAAIVAAKTAELRDAVAAANSSGESVRFAIVEGFLLYAEDMKNVWDLFDIRLLLAADYQQVKSRREARKGYVTLEGFWEDPPGYVDAIVWPNYVKYHRTLYVDGDVSKGFDESKCKRLGIDTLPDAASNDMTASFAWAVDRIAGELRRL
jgi:nicotinamide/nicotinate riboside kinase